jgi:hypothetical protein
LNSGTWIPLSPQPAVSRDIPHARQFGTLPPRSPLRVAGVVLYHDARFVRRPTGGAGTPVTGSGESGGPSTPTTARESGAQQPTPGRPARNNSSSNGDTHPRRTLPTLHATPKPSTSLVDPCNRPRVRCGTRSAIAGWRRLALTTAPEVPVGHAPCGTQGPEQARPGLRPYAACCRPS